MNVDTKNLIGVSEASSKGISKLVADVEDAGDAWVILRQNKAVAALVNIDCMDRLDRIDELEDDLRLLSIALVRSAADSGRRYDLDEVLAEVGIDANTLDDEE